MRTPGQAPARDLEMELHEACSQYYADPLGFVHHLFPWPINGESGPDAWQAEVLRDVGRAVEARGFNGVHPVLPIRLGISSGHGIGKGALFAWLVDWIMSTRPQSPFPSAMAFATRGFERFSEPIRWAVRLE